MHKKIEGIVKYDIATQYIETNFVKIYLPFWPIDRAEMKLYSSKFDSCSIAVDL